MKLKTLALALAATGALAAGPAWARDLYDDAFFVRPHATAAELFQDRAQCRDTSNHLSDADAAYSNPRYGALSAMGSALNEDALHDGGLQSRLQRAVFDDCMKQRGWTPSELSNDDSRMLRRASARHPEALDVWLKAHEPTPEAAAAPAASDPVASVVKTAAAAPAAASAKPSIKSVKLERLRRRPRRPGRSPG